MFEIMDGLPDDVIGINATGTVEPDEYDNTLRPLIDAAVAQHGKIGLLMVMGPDFDGYSAGAAWDDTKLGFAHATSFRRLAVVTDHQALRTAIATFMYLVPGKSKGFSLEDLQAAKAWVSEPD